MPAHMVPMMKATIESVTGDVAELAIAIDSRSGNLKEMGAQVTQTKTDYKALRKRIDNALEEAAAAKSDVDKHSPVMPALSPYMP